MTFDLARPDKVDLPGVLKDDFVYIKLEIKIHKENPQTLIDWKILFLINTSYNWNKRPDC